MHAQNSCPQCGLIDKIEKVSAIVLKETSSGTRQEWVSNSDGGYWTTTPYTGMSNLGRTLAAPPKPHYSPSLVWIVAPFIIHPVAYAWWAPISRRMKIALAINAIFWATLYLFGYIISVSDGFGIVIEPPTTNFVEVMVFLIGCTGFCMMIPLSYAAYFIGMRQETRNRRNRLEASEIPVWRNAMERWNELYYCHRDGCIFDPNTGKFGRLDKIAEMIYS